MVAAGILVEPVYLFCSVSIVPRLTAKLIPFSRVFFDPLNRTVVHNESEIQSFVDKYPNVYVPRIGSNEAETSPEGAECPKSRWETIYHDANPFKSYTHSKSLSRRLLTNRRPLPHHHVGTHNNCRRWSRRPRSCPRPLQQRHLFSAV